MTEAPVSPRFRTTPEAFPAGETAEDYAAGFGGGDEICVNFSEGARTEESPLSDFNGLARLKIASIKNFFLAAHFSSPFWRFMAPFGAAGTYCQRYGVHPRVSATAFGLLRLEMTEVRRGDNSDLLLSRFTRGDFFEDDTF
ncbi:hypothetical protein [Mesorhizobium sp. IMUNJ 23232]|uniref:hypothetical protein n=1 Tax=Mesorhizobium sp. IMUNJ 23232 TaxID=3376064 RepID=UPI00378AE5C7